MTEAQPVYSQHIPSWSSSTLSYQHLVTCQRMLKQDLQQIATKCSQHYNAMLQGALNHRRPPTVNNRGWNGQRVYQAILHPPTFRAQQWLAIKLSEDTAQRHRASQGLENRRTGPDLGLANKQGHADVVELVINQLHFSPNDHVKVCAHVCGCMSEDVYVHVFVCCVCMGGGSCCTTSMW